MNKDHWLYISAMHVLFQVVSAHQAQLVQLKLKMKFFSAFSSFVALIAVATHSLGFSNKAFESALVKISEHLAEKNQLVSIVAVGSATEQTLKPIKFSIPQIVFRVQEERISEFMLNSSAIVTFESAESLERFNHKVFSLSHWRCQSRYLFTFSTEPTPKY